MMIIINHITCEYWCSLVRGKAVHCASYRISALIYII